MKLPKWVVARAVDAYRTKCQSTDDDDLEARVHAALQELLKIIVERAGDNWVIDGPGMLAEETLDVLLSEDYIG